jgi:hypothetical protein
MLRGFEGTISASPGASPIWLPGQLNCVQHPDIGDKDDRNLNIGFGELGLQGDSANSESLMSRTRQLGMFGSLLMI